MNPVKKAVGVVLGLGLLVACGGCYNHSEVQAFLRKDNKPISGEEYRVLPPDQIAIRSTRIPEIDKVQQQLRPDGRVNLPLVGEVFCSGMTCKEIEQAICQAAKPYYNDTECTVSVASYQSQRFYVFGQVTKPGPYPWTGRDTLLDVLAQAQPNTLAWMERIRIVRGDGPQVCGRACTQPSMEYSCTGINPEDCNNPRATMMVNVMAMVRSGDLSNNILLQPNDVIYVQAEPLAKVGLALQSLLFPVRPAIETMQTPAAVAAPGL
jgi:protein involved in polysaccharide export with SLBB domain